MAELLLELYSEEIPAGMQLPAAEDLARRVTEKLIEAGYLIEASQSFSSPHRITLSVLGLPLQQKDTVEERKGPRIDAPEKALNGFLKSSGLTKDQLEVAEDKKGAFYVARLERKGRSTVEVLQDLLPEAIAGLKWPKSMRWGANSFRWVRPLHNILCVFDGEPVAFELAHLSASGQTRGHRFHANDWYPVRNTEEYITTLSDRKVIIDHEQRKRVIEEDAKNLVFAEGLELVADEKLLAENAGLVEWPVVLVGQIDDLFIRPISEGGLPPEVLTSAMRKHQKYFSVRDPKTGALAPRFVVVSNLAAPDGGKEIIAGNERVLRARLSDAKFFWDNDRARTLESRVESLEQIIFHAQLGTVRQKVDRVVQLAGAIADGTGVAAELAQRAALLCKADLVSELVGEFPDLQGLMGRYYAQNDGEKDAVARAVEEHYAPLGPGDRCPNAPESVTVAIADKIDTLVGFFAIGETPTGSKDPYALRRAALGIIRLILENSLRLPLATLIGHAAEKYQDLQGLSVPKQTQVELLSFFVDRLKVYLRDAGAPYDLIDAVFALPGQDDLVTINQRVDALKSFLDSEDGANLLTAYKRASSILRIEEKKDKSDYKRDPDPSLFTLDEEKSLHAAIVNSVKKSKSLAAKEDFGAAMEQMSLLRAPVDAFFDQVTVNVDESELRRNRLFLLSQIRTAVRAVADFDRIAG